MINIIVGISILWLLLSWYVCDWLGWKRGLSFMISFTFQAAIVVVAIVLIWHGILNW